MLLFRWPTGLARASASKWLLLRRGAASAALDPAALSRWGARLTHDNTYLSYTRNAIICTVAGGALMQYHVSQGRPPLAGAGLLFMGGTFMYSGSVSYLWQVAQLRVPLQLSKWCVGLCIFNACWPPVLWTASLVCLLDETPPLLIEGLRLVESYLPSLLRTSLFVDPPSLYPVCRLLQGVITYEEARLETVRGHAAGSWSLTKPRRSPLTDLDVVSIISRRLERLGLLCDQLNGLARSPVTVPTAVVAPLLRKMRIEVEQLDKILETDVEHDHTLPFWRLRALLSSEHRLLQEEREACRRLLVRIAAVRFTAVDFLARGQVGVGPEAPHESELRRSDPLK